MSSSLQESSSSTPTFQPIFEKALKEYKKKTGKDLTAHPLAVQIEGCKSHEAVLAVLEGKANELNQSRSSDERLTKWLNPTVNILTALSATLGQGAGLIFPPTTIIFSGIGILLVAAKDTVAHRDVLITLFRKIESFFERLKIYTKVPPSAALSDELAKIMAEVLSILAIATKGIKQRQIKISLKNVAGMNDLEDALQRFGELEQREILTGIAQLSCDTAVIKDDTSETRADMKETNADVKEAKAMVKDIVDKMDAREWKDVLQNLKGWLTPPDPSTNYAIGLRDHHEETTTWFLGGRIFQEWHLAGSLLWIHGKPGSGKSILCSAIIQRILSLSGGGRASVAYFYFDFRDDNKKHRHNLLSSLLIQFAADSIPCCDVLSRVYSAHGKGAQPPSDEVLVKCLTDMLRLSATIQHPIYIIVDALDESPNTFGVRSPRERVLSFIKDLVHLRLPNLHLCVTSRPEIDIRNRIEPLASPCISLHDQAEHKEDIARYIRSEVEVVAYDKRWREDDKTLVIETLCQRADGMFRWVYCQLEMLRLCLRSNVRHFLNELPDSLDETYERILKGIHKTNRVNVQRLLRCLAVAIRPLRVEEVAAILTFDPDAIEGEVLTLDADSPSEDREQELLSACPSLITIVDGPGWRTVQFSHFSVKEFLTSDRLATSSQDISRYHILSEAAHTTLAQTSLDILLRLDDRFDRSDLRNIPLVGYAADHWVYHAQVGSVSSHLIRTMKTLFDSDKPHFAAWVRIHNMDNVRSWHMNTATPLYFSALCGFYDLVEHLVQKRPQDVNAIGGRHNFPLIAALHGGYIRVAELLVQHGADVSLQGQRQDPLHGVVYWPQKLAVGALQFLLRHGVDVNTRDESNSTPLHLASTSLVFRSMRMLLDHGADVNAQDRWDRTPLHEVHVIASDVGDGRSHFQAAQAAQLLVDRGADVNKPDKDRETPLHLASRLVLLEVAWILLKGGADPNVENREGKIPFQIVQEIALIEMGHIIVYPDMRKRRVECVALMSLLLVSERDVTFSG